jgi:ubiquinone biosynthesis protein
VHLARLKTGEQVIVKIQRPNIKVNIKNDLEIIIGLARIAENRSPAARQLGLVSMLEEYARLLLRSLDYGREARNTERIYHSFAKDPRVIIPRIYRQYCTDRVLTEEYITGVKLSDIKELDRHGWDRRKISRLGTEAFLSQVMLYGFFQSDPHPGNILVIDEDHIAFIDFGEVGSLTGDRLIYIGKFLLSISSGDIDQALTTLDDMGITADLVSQEDLREDFQEDFNNLVESITVGGIGNIDMNRLRQEVMILAFQYRLKLPSYLTALMKAFITVEGVGKKLDPAFDFMEVARPIATRVYLERLKPGNMYKYARRKYYRHIKPLGSMPGNLNTLLKNTGEGRLVMNIKIDLSDKASRKATQLINRTSSSLIITGALIGSSMIISANHPAIAQRFSMLGVAGFALAIILLLVYFLSSFKS